MSYIPGPRSASYRPAQQAGGSGYGSLAPEYPPQGSRFPAFQQQPNYSTDSLAPGNPFADPSSSSNHAYRQQQGGSNMTPYGLNAGGGPAATQESLIRPQYSPDIAEAKQQHGAWMEGGKEPVQAAAWKKWTLIAGLGVLVIAGVAGGIAAWRIMANKNSSSSNSNGATSSAESVANSGDPSKFTKDSRLHQSFYGIAYTPLNTLMPWCGAVQANVTADIQLLSQITTRIRTYGSDCNATNMILQAIQDTKVNMTTWLGVYVDDNSTTWERQKADTLQAIQTYGTDHISGIIVGNEYILDQDLSAASYTFIEDKVAEFKTAMDALKLDKAIEVGTADAGSAMTKALCSKLEFAMSNVHPWFGGVPIDQAAGWTWEYFQENDVAVAGSATPYIAETGWPSRANTTKYATYQASVAGIPQLQTFLDTFVCQANTNETRYFYFEAFDEPWKEIYGGVEPYWGLFDSDRNLKNITIPNCPPTAS